MRSTRKAKGRVQKLSAKGKDSRRLGLQTPVGGETASFLLAT